MSSAAVKIPCATLVWSKSLPDRAGWYWLRVDKPRDDEVVRVYVTVDGVMVASSDGLVSVGEFEALCPSTPLWAGPIEEPVYDDKVATT